MLDRLRKEKKTVRVDRSLDRDGKIEARSLKAIEELGFSLGRTAAEPGLLAQAEADQTSKRRTASAGKGPP